MVYIEWADAFSVKVKEIDDQHKKLIGMINTLHDALMNKRGKDVYKRVLDEMTEYAVTHFATEEKYMLRFQFPGYQEHKREHDVFAQKAAALQDEFSITGFVFTLPVVSFLKEWLQHHILVTDKKYSAFFNDHGLR